MSIEIDGNNFHHSGDLNTACQKAFWNEINRAMWKLDMGEISLRPRNFKIQAKSSQLPQHKSQRKRKLPTPPPSLRKEVDKCRDHHGYYGTKDSRSCRHGDTH